MPNTYDEETQDLLKKYNLTAETGVDEMKIRDNTINNLKYLMFKYKTKDQAAMPQQDLAVLLGIGAPQLSKILKGNQILSIFPCLERVRSIFGYSIDEFLYTDIEKMEKIFGENKENLPVASYMKFSGVYQLYYFDTSSFKGREHNTNGNALKSGIMYIEEERNTGKYKVIAIFNMNKDRADEFYRDTLHNGWKNMRTAQEDMISMSGYHVYHGELELSSKHVFINVRFENTRDRVQMIFHRPDSSSDKYIGGLGTMVSVSKGRSSAPCLQYIALADTSLEVSAEELASHMLMHYPSIKTYETIDDLVDFVVNLYSQDPEMASQLRRLSDEQKKTLVRNYIDKIVNDTVEKNLFRTVVVSQVDDDEFYHYIKRIKARMNGEWNK